MVYFYKLKIKYHYMMREFWATNQYIPSDMKAIFHDMRIQKYKNKLEQ